MAIFESQNVLYNNINSQDMKIINCYIDTGLFNEPFMSTLEIIENRTKNRHRPHFNLLKRNPLSFKTYFAFTDGATKDDVAALSRWLYTDFYLPMQFSAFPDRIYYCMPINDIKWVHNGNFQGYCEINWRCDDYTTFSPVFSTQIYDLSTNPISGTNITLQNKGDINCYPTILVQVISGSVFTVTNNSNAGAFISFSGLNVNENLTIDNSNMDIQTDQVATYRYSAMSGDFLQLVRGTNSINIKGNIRIQFLLEYRILQS